MRESTRQIVERLIAVVPPPRAAPPRPQSSWATLKVGDVLSRPGATSGELGNRAPELWELCGVSSAGATLRPWPGGGEALELTDRNWKELGWRKLAMREFKKLRESDD